MSAVRNHVTVVRDQNPATEKAAPRSWFSTTSAAGAGDEYTTLPVKSLLPADSPRLAGEDLQHAQLLANADTELPPILVQRKTLRVVDGMHRLRAAMLRGQQTIKVRLFDGSDDAAFVTAVRTNITHGLPLSLADREAAAARIIGSHPVWSDRAIATVTGLSPKTVGAIRRRLTAGATQLHSRIGRDGRIRPLNGAEGRRRASELLAMRPDASLREIARGAGISPGTARDVRERIRRGEDPIPPRQRPNNRRTPLTPERQLQRRANAGRVGEYRGRATILRNLRCDPSVRFTESGRNLLRWLEARVVGIDGWERVAGSVPPHCAYVIVDLACELAEEWLDLAEQLRRRTEMTEGPEVDDRPASSG